MKTLIYQDTRPMYFMELKQYNGRNMKLNKFGQKLNVSEKEAGFLLKIKNGNKNIFIEQTESEVL